MEPPEREIAPARVISRREIAQLRREIVHHSAQRLVLTRRAGQRRLAVRLVQQRLQLGVGLGLCRTQLRDSENLVREMWGRCRGDLGEM